MSKTMACASRIVNAAPAHQRRRIVGGEAPIKTATKVKYPWSPLGRFLRARRRAMQFTRHEVAEMIGASYSTIWRYEQNIILPDPNNIAALAEVLEFDKEPIIDLIHDISIERFYRQGWRAHA